MDFSELKDFKKSYWYRGNKTLTVNNYTNNIITFSNNDVLKKDGDNIYLNKNLISNISDLTIDELMYMYIQYLKKKGYKFI